MAPLTSQEKLAKLRQLMSSHSINAYIVPSADSHNSEYPSEHDKRRQYISSFTGSAGVVVVTDTKALLWTDGRYFIQAAEELDLSCWTLMKSGTPDTPTFTNWLKQQSNEIKVVGADPFTLSVGSWKDLTKGNKLKFVAVPGNLIDEIWRTETDPLCQQPAIPTKPITVHPLECAGKSVADKLSDLHTNMAGVGESDPYEAILLTETPDVAWLFNLRGDDFDFNPMFLSFAIVTRDSTRLYCHDNKLTPEALKHLEQNNVVVRPYDAIVADLEKTVTSCRNVLMDTSVCLALYEVVEKQNATPVLKISSVKVAKAIKNKTEIAEFKEGHIQDALALCTYLCWIEKSAADGTILNETEYSVAVRLEQLRRSQPDNCGLSFPSISSIDANGAVIHYSPPEIGSKKMTHGVYLIDSGGQYRGSTTDVTRTLHLGNPTAYQQECWTRVLKGHIALARAVFPKGTRGPQLDVLARLYLWESGMNYLHGTGHGVGAHLSVHEGPCGISNALQGSAADTVLEEGMVLSNEPGIYISGHFGVRHENLVHIVPLKLKTNSPSPLAESDEVPFYGFEDLTLVPFQRKFAMRELLTKEELNYVNSYHRRCWDTLSPRTTDDVLLSWLKSTTAPWE